MIKYTSIALVLSIATATTWIQVANAHSTSAKSFWSQPLSHYKGKDYWSGEQAAKKSAPPAARRANKHFFAPSNLPLNGKGVGY